MSDAFGQEEQEPLILVRKVKVEGGHHGGAWKVAYADFVTAMMAFFLLLWLLNATTEEQMNGLSDYFAPTSVAAEDQGLGQALAGLAVAAEGAMRSDSARPAVSVAIPSFGEEEEGDQDGETRDDARRKLVRAVERCVLLGVNGNQRFLANLATLPAAERTALNRYVVRRGDTLSAIAARFGASVGEIRRENGLEGSIIRIGQTLSVPATTLAQNGDRR